MASAPVQSSNVEFRGQRDIKKPEPLRIVKERANTITGCSTPREVPGPRTGSGESHNTRKLSPDHSDKSLMIFKRRKPRGSVLDGDLEWNNCDRSKSSEIFWAAEKYNLRRDNNSTSSRRPRSSFRVNSAGSFLKSELFRGSSESDLSISCPQTVKVHPRGRNERFNPLCMDLFPSFELHDVENTQKISSTPGQRPETVRKRLVSKALDGIGNARAKSMQFIHSKTSKEYLARQMSLRNLDSSHQTPSQASSRLSSNFSFEKELDFRRDSSFSSVIHVDERLSLPNISYILFPEVTVVPEIDTVEFGQEVSLWVAIVVTGVLQKTVVCNTSSISLTSKRCQADQDNVALDSSGYGYLYGLNIKLAARKDCTLEIIVTEPNQPRRLYLGQTELILAKVKLLVGKRRPSHVRESSKELIADLESQLGNATTEYLTIEVSYKQSVFPRSRDSSVTTSGLSYHTTTLRTEAHAVIKRHCSGSSWSYQTSEEADLSGISNRLLPLITSHCSPVKAARLISKIASDPVFTAEVEQVDHNTSRCQGFSSDTINIISKTHPAHTFPQFPLSTTSASEPASMQSLDITQAGYHDPNQKHEILALNPCNDLDPAHRIWLDMRKTSRGTGRRDSYLAECHDLPHVGRREESDEVESHVREEQAKLIRLALKNKRSLGAETLRSMAAPQTSMTLGMGRGWGWSPPWW